MGIKKASVVNIKDRKVKPKDKVIVKKKKPIAKKVVPLHLLIREALVQIADQYPEMYCDNFLTYIGFNVIYKKIKREVKITKAKNIFMIFESIEAEEFVIPIIINNITEGKSGCTLNALQSYRNIGIKEITVQSIDEMIEKLNELK